MSRIVRGFTSRVRRYRSLRATAAFFRMPYEARVAAIQANYSHDRMRESFDRYFSEGPDLIANPQPFYNLILAYSRVLKPAAIMQIGCFTVCECRWLVMHGCPARLIATDFDAARLDYLRARFAGTRYEVIEFRPLDLERAATADFLGIDMVVCNTVLSNLQPEGLRRLLAALAASAVSCLLVSDVYVRESLAAFAHLRSIPCREDRNWFHPYMALAREHGFEAFFIPDFTYSSYLEARGMFVVHRGIPLDVHERAIAGAMRAYIGRQDAIWPADEADDAQGMEAEVRLKGMA